MILVSAMMISALSLYLHNHGCRIKHWLPWQSKTREDSMQLLRSTLRRCCSQHLLQQININLLMDCSTVFFTQCEFSPPPPPKKKSKKKKEWWWMPQDVNFSGQIQPLMLCFSGHVAFRIIDVWYADWGIFIEQLVERRNCLFFSCIRLRWLEQHSCSCLWL